MTIYWYTDELQSLTVYEDSSSYRYRALMQKTLLMLKFSLPEFVEIPVGAWVEFRGEKYYLRCPEDIKKQGVRNIEYTLNMYSKEASIDDYKLRNTVDHRLKFSMCARPHEFLKLIVDNLRERDGDIWQVGSYVDSTEKTVEFNHSNIADALQSVADVFETEWEISTDNIETLYTISLGKVEYHKEDPYPLSYGKGNGFVPGVGRTSKVDEKPIKRLYVQGGERNIDRSKNIPSLYRGGEPLGTDVTSSTLLLPIGQSIRYDGEHFEDEPGFDEATARTYTVDADGYSIQRTDKDSKAVAEESLDCSENYPKRMGNCIEVEEVDSEKHFWDFRDPNIPDALNYENYLIGDEKMTVVFQSGMLSGKEFEVEYIHDDKRFKIVPQEIDGITMPDRATGFYPKEKHGNPGDDDYYPGDEYVVFNCMLPNAYICNNPDKSGGAWDMFREAVKYMYDHEDQKYTFTGVLQGLWAKRNWEQIKDYMRVGAYILFSDTQFAPEGNKIRIVGVKEMLTDPYSPTIELSNSVGGGISVSSKLKEIDKTEVTVEDAKRDIIHFTKRRFRDAVETMSMLQGAVDGFSDAVNPITIQTMAALIGDESLQFQFVMERPNIVVESNVSYVVSPPNFVYNRDTRRFHVSGRKLQHLTLPKHGEEKVLTAQTNRSLSDYPMWDIPAWTSEPLDGNTTGSCFLYAKCEVNGTAGRYVLSDVKHSMRETENGIQYYYFLVGILSSEIDGDRSFVSVYGFTEILPGRITTDRLVSTDGDSWLSLVDGAMKLGDALSYNEDGQKELRLKFLAAENSRLGGWIIRDGKFYSEDGGCFMDGATGDIVTTGLILKRMTHIDSSNANDYIREVVFGDGFHYYSFDFFKAGSLIMVDETPRINGIPFRCYMPTLYAGIPSTDEQKATFRSYIGCTIIVYNNSSEYLTLEGNITPDDPNVSSVPSLAPGYMAKMECRVRAHYGIEETYWLTTVAQFT